MSEETIKCPKCGTENKSTDDFCNKCESNLKEKKKHNITVNTISSLIDITIFIISACIVSLIFDSLIGIALFGIADNIEENENLLQQIFYLTHISSITAGFIVTAFAKHNAKLKRIEKSINEIKQKLQ